METVIILVAYFAGLSVAVERIVEITKTYATKPIIDLFKFDTGIYQVQAALVGGAIALISPMPVDLPVSQEIFAAIAGFAVSGGSGFWNSILNNLRAPKLVEAKSA